MTIKLDDAQALQGLLARFPAIADAEIGAAMHEAAKLLEGEVKDATPTAYGALRQSVASSVAKTAAGGWLGVVGTGLAYAVPVELGTKPHFPPVEPLIDWVLQKIPVGQALSIKTRRPLKQKSTRELAKPIAIAIAWKIYHRGTAGAFMFRDTFKRLEPAIQGRFREAAAAVARRADG